MIRKPQRLALPALLAASLALGMGPAAAGVSTVWVRNDPPTIEIQTRKVATDETEQVAGAREVLTRQPHRKEQILSPVTKLVIEEESRTYRVPVTTYPLSREETREVTTTRAHFERVTTETRPEFRATNYRIVPAIPGQNDEYSGLYANPPAYVRENLYHELVGRAMPYYFNLTHYPGALERVRNAYEDIAPAAWDRGNSLLIKRYQVGGLKLRYALVFDKQLKFQGGYLLETKPEFDPFTNRIQELTKGYWITSAAIILGETKDTLVFVQDPRNRIEDPAPRTVADHAYDAPLESRAETTRHEFTLEGKLLIVQGHTVDVEKEIAREPFTQENQVEGPWTPTGKLVRGTGSLEYATGSETELLSQRIMVRTENQVSSVGNASSLNGRQIFKGDAGKGSRGSGLSGAALREQLGANRAKAGALAPTPAPAPRPAASPTPKPSASPQKVSEINPAGMPDAGAWFFPGGGEPSLRARYEAYRTSGGMTGMDPS